MYRTLLGLILCLVVSKSLFANDVTELNTQLAERYAVYAMMASNAYLDKKNRTYFPLENMGWVKVDMNGRPVTRSKNSYSPRTFWGRWFSNLQFDIWAHKDQAVTVFAFKGTDEKIDWLTGNIALGISIPYKSAKKQVKKYAKNNPGRRITLTGHSLGGGLALSVSVWEGFDAFVFNTSPRIFDGLKNMNRPAVRKAIYEKGEILEKLRKHYPKFVEKIPTRDIVRTDFDYGGVSEHRADFLAEGILRCASSNQDLVDFAKSLELKVKCNFGK